MSIKKTLHKALQGDSTKERVIVLLAQKMAHAYLRTHNKQHYRLYQFITGSFEDFAWDAIADLFERREGKLVKLERWTSVNDVFNLSEVDFTIEFRKLVFTQVNDHTFSTYRKKDATLAKIIRNLKRALIEKNVDGLTYHRESGLIYLQDQNPSNLNPYSPEVIEAKLSAELNKIKNIVEVLVHVRSLLENSTIESRTVSLKVLSIAIRNISVRVNEIDNEVTDLKVFEEYELIKVLNKVMLALKAKFYNSYVLKGKLSLEEFSHYISCTNTILHTEYINGKDKKDSFHEYFVHEVYDVSAEEYKAKHRVILEYFVKTARNSFISTLKSELESADKTS